MQHAGISVAVILYAYPSPLHVCTVLPAYSKNYHFLGAGHLGVVKQYEQQWKSCWPTSVHGRVT
jgi:hypothetical protein